jgi:hypothetical protein
MNDMELMDANFDFGSLEDDLFGTTMEPLPMYDSMSLAHGIDSMGSLSHAMPSLEQTLGSGYDLTVATKLKDIPPAPSPKRKKRRHRRSISDPEVVRQSIFHATQGMNGEAAAAVSGRGGMEVEAPAPVNHIDMMDLDIMDLSLLDDFNAVSPSFFRKEQQEPKPAFSSASSVSSGRSSSSRRSRNKFKGEGGRSTRSRNYACSKCGQPKKGHVCPLAAPAPPKMVSMATQVDLRMSACERVLVTRPFRSFSMC